jgi:heme A synthase
MLGVAGFRRLALVTAIFAYLQIALGGLVRVSGSGLGCPDWPLCHGRPYPPADPHAIIEYSHRAVGSVTGILIIATVVLAWVVFRTRRPVVAWLATASLVGVVGEGVLGAGVVANELASWLVLVHLALAMIILGFLIATAVMAEPPSPGVGDRRFRYLATAAVAGTFVMLLTGSSVVASNADQSCRSWPLCSGGFTPSFAGSDAFTMLHRGTVLVVGLLLIYVLVTAMARWRRGWNNLGFANGGGAIAQATLVVLVVQIAVGGLSAITAEPLFNGLHVALATLVWAGVLTISLLMLPRTDRSIELSRLAVEKSSA